MTFFPSIDGSYCFIRPAYEETSPEYNLYLENVIQPLAIVSNLLNQMQQHQKHENARSPGQQISKAHMEKSEDKFHVNVDVQQFRPEEITVKVTDKNIVTVEGKHDEKQDEHGFISRHFIRKYVLSEEYDMSKVESRLSSDGVLTILAPKIQSSQEYYRDIPVIRTGESVKLMKKVSDDAKVQENN